MPEVASPAWYRGLAALQACDIVTTATALGLGAVETNPLAADLTGHPTGLAAILAVKLALVALLWAHRSSLFVAPLATTAYAAVVTSNLLVLSTF